MAPRTPNAVVAQLLALVDEAYDTRAWHGTNLRGSLRGLTAEQAAWRPGDGRHNVWEIVVHAAYWKYAVWRRITGTKRGGFAVPGSNWFARPEGRFTQADWRRDLRLLGEEHRRLREVIAGLRPGLLSKTTPGSRFTVGATVRGIAAHDLYHAGQIQLLKRLRAR
jgi:hypothetical protein